jgi:hypothetical protein
MELSDWRPETGDGVGHRSSVFCHLISLYLSLSLNLAPVSCRDSLPPKVQQERTDYVSVFGFRHRID